MKNVLLTRVHVRPRRSLLFVVLWLGMPCWGMLAACSADSESAPDPEPLGISTCERTAEMPATLKLDRYRGPTPACVPNGITLNISELQTLQQREPSPVLVDVWAILRRVEEGFGSTWLPNEAHLSLPGAVWLPNVGYARLEPDLDNYLQTHLTRLTAGDKNYPVVFFCVADCWMSWNTVQRVRDYGYTRVYWFKDGTDGWAEAGLELVAVQPVELD